MGSSLVVLGAILLMCFPVARAAASESYSYQNTGEVLNVTLSKDTVSKDNSTESPKFGYHGDPYATAKIWGFSCLAVFINSAIGLACIAMVPLLNKTIYKYMMQCLIATAVGTLSGDAMLHLLPDAYGIIAGSAQGMDTEGTCQLPHDYRLNPTFKGAVALVSIFFFYMLERIMTIFSERNAAKKKNKKLKLDAQKEDEKGDLSNEEMEEEEEDTNLGPSEHVIRMVNSGGGDIVDLLDKLQHEEEAEKSGDVDDEERRRLKSSSSTDSEKGSRKNGNISQANGKHPTVEVIVQGHGHGHSHGAGAEGGMIGSMAWIVIMGDMIHNFCDGIAIGAAFSQSVTGGLSTSIAIVWHELPHELGDFAMCLRAGMSVRQAMFYNLIASVLAFIGMVIGVFAGQAPSATMWIFALAGGNFLYIALVDMLPELTHFKAATLKRELLVLLLQAVGMFSGVILLTGIAVYETDATY